MFLKSSVRFRSFIEQSSEKPTRRNISGRNSRERQDSLFLPPVNRTMSLLAHPVSAPSSLWKLKKPSGFGGIGRKGSSCSRVCFGYSNGVKAFFFNPNEEPILKEALKEPVAFMGGMFAGLLRLDLNEDPLKEWVTRTVEASGITQEELEVEGSKEAEEAPQEIVIE
ncbi:uncharacterized protein LOC116215188 [Punica granatum]|nr:uncharacterized protein LOC116215188 [Punica granatum]